MPTINITRGNAPTVSRGDVKPGQVFAVRNRDGKLGTPYAAIGRNGRLYSAKLSTGELASSDNDAKQVAIIGKWSFAVNRNPSPSVVRTCRRSEVRPGEVFHVVGKSELYAHMGTISMDLEGFLSVPLSRSENHAITRNGNSRVEVVASFTMEAEVAG